MRSQTHFLFPPRDFGDIGHVQKTEAAAAAADGEGTTTLDSTVDDKDFAAAGVTDHDDALTIIAKLKRSDSISSKGSTVSCSSVSSKTSTQSSWVKAKGMTLL